MNGLERSDTSEGR